MPAPFRNRAVTPDFTGQQGGLMALAFAAGATFTATMMLAVGRFIWKTFLEARVRDLEAQLKTEREECQHKITALNNRINQLETMLLLHGPQTLRQAMQAALSEQHLEVRGVAE